MKLMCLVGLFTFLLSDSVFACSVDSSNNGSVEADVVGIEVRDNCTYLFVKNVVTTLPALDSAGFIAGRFNYLGLDPNKPSYNAMLSVANVAFATNTRIYANVTSRLGRVNRFSLSAEENDDQ